MEIKALAQAYAVWTEWIHPRYCQPETLIELRNWFSGRPSGPLSLNDFLQEEKVSDIAGSLSRIRLYEPVYSLYWGKNRTEYRDVTEQEFTAADEAHRFGRHQVITSLPDIFTPEGGLSEQEQMSLESFFRFLFVGQGLKSWMAVVTGQLLEEKVSFEVVRYEKGDFLSPHCDTHDNRLLGLNFYLDPHWQESDGGMLGFINHQEQVTYCPPVFNSISLIPIHESYRHWVNPWNNEKTGRFCISMSFRPL